MPARLALVGAAVLLTAACANYNSLSTVAGDAPPPAASAAYESFHAAFPDGTVIDISAGGLSLKGDVLSADLTVPGTLDIDKMEAERVSQLFKEHAVKVIPALMVAGVETLNLTLRHNIAKKVKPEEVAPEPVPSALTIAVKRYMLTEWQRDAANVVKFFDLIVVDRGMTLDGKLVSAALR